MIFNIILLSVFLVDLILKKYVEAKIQIGEEHSIAGGKILIRKLHNDGLMFGKLSDHPKLIQRSTLGVLGVIIVYYIWLLFQPGQKIKKAGISMLIGGGLCNWFDRVHQGYVTDYISINSRWQKLRRIVFNISDFFLMIGGIFYLFGSIKRNIGK